MIRLCGCCAILLIGCRAIETPTTGAVELCYAVELVTRPELAVEFRAWFQGEPNGESELVVTEGWGGVLEAGEDIQGLEVWSGEARLASVEHPEPFRWVVRHAPAAALEVRWRIEPNDHDAQFEGGRYYRPILHEGLFQMIGNLGLVRPRRFSKGERSLSFTWHGFEAAGWRVIDSFGLGEGERRLRTTLDRLAGGLFVAGEVRLLERSIRGAPLWISIRGSDWAFDDATFADLCARIVEHERAFFDDLERPHYLISLLPVGEGSAQGFALGGTGLTDAFALFVQPGASLDASSSTREPIVRVLAHEMFHEWNGQIVTTAAPEGEMFWFSEGFTNFFTRRLSSTCGLADDAQTLADQNRVFADYYLSPVIDASNQRIREAFWLDSQVQRLPYARGDLAALWLDAEIVAHSRGRHSLDDFFRHLVRRARAGGEPLDLDALCSLARDWIPERALSPWREFVEVGGRPEVDWSALLSSTDVREVNGRTYELGFDFEASRRAGLVKGVLPGSAAQHAGLLDGQVIAGFSLSPGQADTPVQVTVREGTSQRTIEFTPHGEVRSHPVLSRRSARP